MKNLKKNLDHGEGNRVADGATVLGIGKSASDHSHVSRTTPLQTKMKEFAASKAELGSALAPDVNKELQARTTAKRRESWSA